MKQLYDDPYRHPTRPSALLLSLRIVQQLIARRTLLQLRCCSVGCIYCRRVQTNIFAAEVFVFKSLPRLLNRFHVSRACYRAATEPEYRMLRIGQALRSCFVNTED